MLKQFQRWDLIAWFVWMAMFVVLESFGLARKQDATLTYLTRQAVPRWILAGLVGWLFYHFVVVTGGK